MGLINNSIKSFIWNVLGAGIGFIFQMIAARLLGAEKFGQANYLLGYVATITVFTSFGLQTYLPKYISKNNSKKLFSDIFWTYTSLFIIANIGIVLIFYGIKIKTINIIIISILSYLTTLSEIILIYNISSGKAVLGMFNRKFLYSTLNLIIFVLSFIALSNKYYIYVGTMIISYIITTIPFIVKNVSKIKVNFLIIKNSIGFYLIQLINGIYFSYSKVLQKEFGTFETVAVLSISLTLGSLVAMLGDNFAKVSMPLFSKYWRENNFKKLEEVYMTTTRINSYLVLPIALTLILNSNRILKILGKGYHGGDIIFILIMISQFINSFTGPNGTVLVMTNYTKYEILNGIIKLITSVGTMIVLGKRYIWAVAFSLTISEVVVNILKTIQVKMKVGILPYEIKNFIYVIFIALVEFLLISSISKIQNFLIWVITMSITVILSYIITFNLSPDKDDREFIKTIVKKINNIF